MRYTTISDMDRRILQVTGVDCVAAATAMAVRSARGLAGHFVHAGLMHVSLPCGTEFEPAAEAVERQFAVKAVALRGVRLHAILTDYAWTGAIALGIDPSFLYACSPSRHAVFLGTVDVPQVPAGMDADRGLVLELARAEPVGPVGIVDPHPRAPSSREWFEADIEPAYVRAGSCALWVPRVPATSR